MTGSAQLDTLTLEPLESSPAASAGLPSALKLQVAERLEAHRLRKSSAPRPNAAPAPVDIPPAQGRRAHLAATVAERYAQTPSYRAFLAEQAQRAIEAAAAAADVAVRSAQAIAEAQQSLLAELELWSAPQQFTPATAHIARADQTFANQTFADQTFADQSPSAESQAQTPLERLMPASHSTRVRVPMPENSGAPVRAHSPAGLSVHRYEQPAATRPAASLPNVGSVASPAVFDYEEALALDAEIAFRQSPIFDDFAAHPEPPVPLAANLLEFPRQLIAARKARPRLAEGPLMQESTPRTPQLRIFEVEAEHFAVQPSAAPQDAPVQSFIYLDSETVVQAGHALSARYAMSLNHAQAPDTASIPRRLLALTIDLLLVTAAVAAAAETAAKIAGTLPAGMNGAITAAATLTGFWIVYQLLFFTLSDHTPGMRCARIGLCTLSDENPSRTAMRRRVLAQWIAILPFGMGMLWALLDDDRLGWHDRISQMYQRAY